MLRSNGRETIGCNKPCEVLCTVSDLEAIYVDSLLYTAAVNAYYVVEKIRIEQMGNAKE